MLRLRKFNLRDATIACVNLVKGRDIVDKSSFVIAIRAVTEQADNPDPEMQEAVLLINNTVARLSLGLLFVQPNIKGVQILGVGNILWQLRHVKLTVGEFRVMKCLWNSHGAPVTYRDLFCAVHNGAYYHTGAGEEGLKANVRSCIKRIRRKFEVVDPEFAMIQSCPVIGYRWGTQGVGHQ